jgi:HEAT repeat protein
MRRMKQSGKYWLKRLKSRSRKRSHEAVLVLGGLTEADAEILPDLMEALKDSDEKQRFWGTVAVGRLGVRGEAATPVLMALLDDPVVGVRQSALGALSAVAASTHWARKAVEGMMKVLKNDPSHFVRRQAAQEIGEMGEAARIALRLLVDVMYEDADDYVRVWAAIALKMLGTVAAPVGKQVREAVRSHPDKAVRSQLEVVVKTLDGTG